MATPASPIFRLRDLLPEATFLPAGCEPIGSAVSADPAQAGPGGLYVHLDEFDASGAELAAERGAAAVIAERLLPGIDAPLVVVADVRDAYARLRGAEAHPSSKIECFLVTGSVGRAVTSNLLSRIVSAAGGEGAKAVIALNPNRHTETTPPPRIVCLTNLRADGLSTDGERRWESVAEHRDAVHRTLGGLNEKTTLVANADDPDALAIASRHPGPLVTFGERPEADVVVTEIESFPGGQEFLVTHGAESSAVTVATPGAAFRANCVAAIAAGLAAGFDLERCVHAVELAPRPYGMLEPVICGQPFPVALDRATRPVALRSALRAALPAGGGRLYAAIHLATDAAVAAEQLAAASRLADRVIASAPTPKIHDSPAGENVTIVNDRLAAMAISLGLADEGDAVLVAGCATSGLQHDRRAAEGLLKRRLACLDTAAAA